MTLRTYSDPVERVVAEALTMAGVAFVDDRDPRAKNLDFYLPDFDVFIEVKQFHANRIARQMAKVENIIVIQGLSAAQTFAKIINRKPS